MKTCGPPLRIRAEVGVAHSVAAHLRTPRSRLLGAHRRGPSVDIHIPALRCPVAPVSAVKPRNWLLILRGIFPTAFYGCLALL